MSEQDFYNHIRKQNMNLGIEPESFDAKKARTLSENVVSDASKTQLNEVIQVIGSSCGEGKTECYYYKSILKNVEMELNRRGFTIKNQSDQREGICYSIQG